MRNQTNQKLSRVKMLLVQLEQADNDDANLIAAMAEAVLLELGLAYRCYLSELASAYGVTAQLPSSAAALAATLAEQPVYVAEVDELANLEKAQQWPHTLLLAARPNLQAAPQPVLVKSPANLIDVLEVDENTENKLSYSHCFEIYQALRSCIERQRDMAQQW